VTGPASPGLPASFAGLSVETTLVPSWFLPNGCHSGVRAVLAMLGRPEIRVGGNSQDRLWPTAPLPPGEHQVVDIPYFHALHCLSAIRSPLLVGLNLLGRNAAATGDLLSKLGYVVPPDLLTIALGNEPDLYGSRLPAPGDYAGYLALYGQTLDALRGRLGGFLPPIAGPDPATWRWTTQTADFISSEHPAVADEHVYGLNGCSQTPGSPTYPTVAQLLSPFASSDLIAALSPVVSAARRAHIPAQISEANSVACGGVHGVSDGPPSALWALSFLGSAATAGFSRVEFHSSGGAYDPFVLTPNGITFRPLFSAMVLADRLWPAGSRPLRLSGSLPTGLAGWVARRPDGSLGVLLVNSDLNQAKRIVLDTPAGQAILGRLQAAGASAVTLDGQQLVWASGRPSWKGHRRLERPPVRSGRLTVRLTPGSAAWLVLRAPPAGRSTRTPAG
jgi:hypothetical protein